MSKTLSKTTIEWSERVWNFLTGCTKISAGCKFCYMFVLAVRLKAMGNPMYRNGAKLTVHEQKLMLPYSIKKPTAFFVNSMSDMFHPDVPLSILVAAFEVMNNTLHHTYQILTKRPERLLELQHLFNFTPNIWIGVSVEDERVLHRVETLKKINAQVRWISAEPLIGSLEKINLNGIHWLVAGGESGNRKDLRPVKEEWILELKNKCQKKGIPFFFKQWGKARFNSNPDDPTQIKGHPQYAKGGCQLQGKVYREFPQSFNNNLKQTKMETTNNNQNKIDESIVQKLSPFKKEIAEALNSGEHPAILAERFAKERKMPRATAQAYVTMVMQLYGTKDFPNSKKGSTVPKKLSPFKQLIANALTAGEKPDELATRLAKERIMPRPTAQAYVTMVLKHQASEKINQ